MISELNTIARRLKYHGMGQGGSVQGLRTERAFSGDTNAIQLANCVVGFSQGLFGAHFDCQVMQSHILATIEWSGIIFGLPQGNEAGAIAQKKRKGRSRLRPPG